tara:strand:- start:4609 stop:5811 length:1203 start_codon:yes stop_codon:yes gene_type:complete
VNLYIKKKIKNLYLIIFDKFFWPVSFTLLLLLKFLNIFIIIRFNYIDRGRVGGYYPIEFYRVENTTSSKTVDIFLCDQLTDHVNIDWYNFWKKKYNLIYVGRFAKLFCKMNESFFCNKNIIPYESFQKFPINSLLIKKISENYSNQGHKLNKNIIKKTKSFYNKFNLKKNKFICFHNRDGSFLEKYRNTIDWSYHNYRDSNITNYEDTAVHLNKIGLKCIRVGETASQELSIKREGIIDLPFLNIKNQALDVSLLCDAKFSIFSETGLSIIPFIFRKPIVFVNWVLLKSIYTFKSGIFILKKVFSLEKDRYLKFNEIIKEIGVSGDGNYYKKFFIFEENTPEEIKEASTEMNDYLDGNLIYDNNDKLLQMEFWKSLGQSIEKNDNFRISKHFLKKYQKLI